MEALSTVISIILLLGLIGAPILLFVVIQKINRLKFRFLIYLILGLITTSGITLTFAWWTDTSNQLLLSHYGYDHYAMNETERFAKVADKNMERVKKLETSLFGVGWPVKAIMTFVFYSPYLLIVYLIGLLISRMKGKKMHLTSPSVKP